MIAKEPDNSASSNHLVAAGRRAEDQMAFYLRRAFAAAPKVSVYNDLRFERNGEIAQIDHLILHNWGMVIVESKSVTSRVEINARSEWSRFWNGRMQGMPSPELQAMRQGDLLRSYLRDHVDQLLSKLLGMLQMQFGGMPIDILVAISDDGIIKQPRKPVECVCKADQIPDRVKVLIAKHKWNSNLLNTKGDGGYFLSDKEVGAISAFLLAHHKPIAPRSQVPQPIENANPPTINSAPRVAADLLPPAPKNIEIAREPSCNVCTSGRVNVEYGRFGYYLKCGNCGANTPIKAMCSKCGRKERIRKNGLKFFSECGVCGSSELFNVNSVAAH